MTLQYKGLDLPNSIFDPRTFGTLTEDEALAVLTAQVHYLNGVDLGQGKVPEPVKVEYRYFHDGDDPSIRYYRRARKWEDWTTNEIFRAVTPGEGWGEVSTRRSIQAMIEDWIEIEEAELPDEAK